MFQHVIKENQATLRGMISWPQVLSPGKRDNSYLGPLTRHLSPWMWVDTNDRRGVFLALLAFFNGPIKRGSYCLWNLWPGQFRSTPRWKSKSGSVCTAQLSSCRSRWNKLAQRPGLRNPEFRLRRPIFSIASSYKGPLTNPTLAQLLSFTLFQVSEANNQHAYLCRSNNPLVVNNAAKGSFVGDNNWSDCISQRS